MAEHGRALRAQALHSEHGRVLRAWQSTSLALSLIVTLTHCHLHSRHLANVLQGLICSCSTWAQINIWRNAKLQHALSYVHSHRVDRHSLVAQVSRQCGPLDATAVRSEGGIGWDMKQQWLNSRCLGPRWFPVLNWCRACFTAYPNIFCLSFLGSASLLPYMYFFLSVCNGSRKQRKPFFQSGMETANKGGS